MNIFSPFCLLSSCKVFLKFRFLWRKKKEKSHCRRMELSTVAIAQLCCLLSSVEFRKGKDEVMRWWYLQYIERFDAMKWNFEKMKRRRTKKSLALFSGCFLWWIFFNSFSCRFVVICCCILAALSQYHHHHSSLLPIEWSYSFSHSTNSDGTGIASLSQLHIEFIFSFSRKIEKKKNILFFCWGQYKECVCVGCILGMWKHITTLLLYIV